MIEYSVEDASMLLMKSSACSGVLTMLVSNSLVTIGRMAQARVVSR